VLERSGVFIVEGVDVEASNVLPELDEALNAFEFPDARREVERRFFVVVGCVDIGLELEEKWKDVCPTVSDGPEKGCFTFGVTCVDGCAVLKKKFGDFGVAVCDGVMKRIFFVHVRNGRRRLGFDEKTNEIVSFVVCVLTSLQ